MILKNKKLFIIVFFACLISLLYFPESYALANVEKKIIQHDRRIREYFIYTPPSYKENKSVPLLMVFHGGKGKAKKFARFTGFNNLSEKYGFIVAYPQGIDGHWNDGRQSERFKAHDKDIDDVGFVMALIENLKANFNIDQNKIFATGMSNGGIFCQRLAVEQSQHFTAIASVTAQMAESLAKRFNPQKPISVLIMNGTDDPLLPYSGGEVKDIAFFPRLPRLRRKPSRGRVLSTAATIDLWLKHNQILTHSTMKKMTDIDNDGVTVELKEWTNKRKGVSVVLYKIKSGGHTWPGGKQYLPERVIGKTCMDINASELIWDFFLSNAKYLTPIRPRMSREKTFPVEDFR
ncbi:MAG: prolyl oligopeptidase family serine peptidase [Candidatus Omnitrophica bacterium]|nr:prolyl oligopeptidase family serine peptidase [Candidatus Omnitrophota bacterium]